MSITVAGYPMATTVGNTGLFDVASTGLAQGTAYPDPATRFALRQGILSQNETIAMYGGVAVYADVPTLVSAQAPLSPSSTLGTTVGRATTVTGGNYPIAGFSVFDQDYSMVNWPGNPVPIIGSGGTVMWYPLGSRARIAVKCSPNLVNLRGEPISTQVSWDFQNQQLEPYSSTTISSGTYTSGTGAVSLTTAANHGLNPGDTFELSSVTGTGSYAQLDGEWTATAGTTGTTLNFTAATGLTLTISGGTVSSGGALTVTIIDVQTGNSQVVSPSPAPDSSTSLYSWNYSGNAAVIQI